MGNKKEYKIKKHVKRKIGIGGAIVMGLVLGVTAAATLLIPFAILADISFSDKELAIVGELAAEALILYATICSTIGITILLKEELKKREVTYTIEEVSKKSNKVRRG